MKTHRWLVAVLFTGALAAAGGVYAHCDGAGKDGHGWTECGEHLPKAKAELLHQSMKQAAEKDKPLIEEARNIHKELKDVVGAKNFDEKKFVDLSDRLGQIRSQIREDHVKAFASVAGQLTPDERRHVIRMWMQRHGHGMEHHGMEHAGWKHHDGDHTMQGHREWHAHERQQYQQPAGQPDPNVVNSTPFAPDKDYPPYSPR